MTTIKKAKLFQHEPFLLIHNGKVKLYCRCGQQASTLFDTQVAALEAHREHVGLRERQSQALMP